MQVVKTIFHIIFQPEENDWPVTAIHALSGKLAFNFIVQRSNTEITAFYNVFGYLISFFVSAFLLYVAILTINTYNLQPTTGLQRLSP